MTLGEWLDQWLEDIAGTIRPNTMTRYQGTVDRHIKPYLRNKPIAQVKGRDVQRLYETLLKCGNRNTGEGLSSGTVRGIHSMLHEALGEAKQILTDEQLERFVEIIREDAVWYDFFYTELTTGLRRGEICGLQWRDFDADDGRLKICRAVHEERGGKLTTWDTKTSAGARTITLPPSTVELLRERKKSALTEWIFPHP